MSLPVTSVLETAIVGSGLFVIGAQIARFLWWAYNLKLQNQRDRMVVRPTLPDSFSSYSEQTVTYKMSGLTTDVNTGKQLDLLPH